MSNFFHTLRNSQLSEPADLQLLHGIPWPDSPLHRIFRLRQRPHYGINHKLVRICASRIIID